MTQEQFEKLMKQLKLMNKNLSLIAVGLSGVKDDTGVLRECLTEIYNDEPEGTTYSLPWYLKAILGSL